MKNLLKLVPLFLLMILFLSAMGCADKTPDRYATRVEDLSNDGILRRSGSETPFWPGEYFQADVAENDTCQALGYSLEGKYNWYIFDKYNSYPTHIYVRENGIEFGIRGDNNKPVLLNLMNKEFFDTEPYLEDVENPEEYGRSYAAEIAGSFIENMDEYKQMTEEPITSVKEKDGKSYSVTYYLFTYYREIAGYRSSDFITVKVTSKGHLASVFVGDTDAFENRSFSIDKEALQQAINEKIAAVYRDTGYHVNNSTVDEQKIVKAPDGGFYIASSVIVQLDDNGEQVNTLIDLLSFLK